MTGAVPSLTPESAPVDDTALDLVPDDAELADEVPEPDSRMTPDPPAS